ncbi:MAG: penicillin-binding protein 1A [Gammaproteobacteria bacterium]|nr:penicillin-binding protein 1A [Gammaproteobacteria bacterium]
MKWNYFRLPLIVAGGVMFITLLGAYALACSYVYLVPSLPSVASMRNVELQVPLRVFTRSGALIAQIGEQRRIPVSYDQIPDLVKHAFVAAEDERFFEHHGIDYFGVVRAVLVDIISGEKSQGASTITMQAARNMFLTLDKTARRKLQETFVTYRMEHEFTKQEIFGLYLNVIFFGQRAYGVAAAAEAFFGKPLDKLDVAEAATIAGVPKAPSRYNPIVNPELATARRAYVLRRMRELGFLDSASAEAANREPMQARAHAPLYDVEAPYVAEMARLELRQRFGANAETSGYKVYTTIDGRLQTAANRAVRVGLIEYDRRHGWRGPAGHVDLPAHGEPHFDNLVDEYSAIGNLSPAIVTAVGEKNAHAYVKGLGAVQIDWDGLSWARRQLRSDAVGPAPKEASQVLSRGDVVYVVADAAGHAQLGQIPEAQSALVALDPNDGSIVALVGGFDYFTNKYNRVTQARRLPGSGFKPFLYSAALENGLTPASVLLDAPIVLENNGSEDSWRPENSTREFGGPTRLREALVRSRNLVSIRVLKTIGIPTAVDYISRFGFEPKTMPHDLTLALGTLEVTPLDIAAGYAVFANGGYRISPYFIDRIEDAAGKVVWRATPRMVCTQCDSGEPPPPAGPAAPTQTAGAISVSEPAHAVATAAAATATTLTAPQATSAQSSRGEPAPLPPAEVAPRVISAQNAYLMADMMTDVIKRGTGRRALALGRSDIAGKTGTTNEAKDTWFNGFTRNLVATVWVGFDQERPLGESEEGARTALPIWIQFMGEALKGVPEQPRTMPDGLVTLRISPENGTLVSNENPEGLPEMFMVSHLPTADTPGTTAQGPESQTSGEPIF